jgi:hypothetical protein
MSNLHCKALNKEEEILSSIFGEDKKWRGYKLSWCHLCDCAIISDGKGGTTCNCNWSGSDEAVEEFRKTKHRVEAYLTEEEKIAYTKGMSLKKLILESLSRGENEINWGKVKYEISENDDELFKNLIEKSNSVMFKKEGV